MQTFTLPDMSCGHCKRAITEHLLGLDAEARLEFDLDQHRLEVDSKLTPEALVQALTDAGYPPA